MVFVVKEFELLNFTIRKTGCYGNHSKFIKNIK